jgi:hypothetical protein
MPDEGVVGLGSAPASFRWREMASVPIRRRSLRQTRTLRQRSIRLCRLQDWREFFYLSERKGLPHLSCSRSRDAVNGEGGAVSIARVRSANSRRGEKPSFAVIAAHSANSMVATSAAPAAMMSPTAARIRQVIPALAAMKPTSRRTDWTRAVNLLTYEQGVEAFRVIDRLSDAEKTALMGETLTRIYKWSPARS